MAEAGATRWLLIDSCAADAVLAVGRGAQLTASVTCAGRGFSAAWPGMLRGLFATAGWTVCELELVGVVTGPGSFTGVRVGLAAAKGLCEALQIPMVALSRLEILMTSAAGGTLAVLDAGRGEFYVRHDDRECLLDRDALLAFAKGRAVLTADASVQAMLPQAVVVPPHVDTAVPLLLARLSEASFADTPTIDANYVRGEREIYARKASTDAAAS